MTIRHVMFRPKSEGGVYDCDEGRHGNETPAFNLESDSLDR